MEEGVVSRKEGQLQEAEETRTRAVGYLRCEGGPHLHELVTSEWGGEPNLPFAVEVEVADEVESLSTARALWGGDGGHG